MLSSDQHIDCVSIEEICNGVDDDCDEQVDEGLSLGESCEFSNGVCASTGILSCVTADVLEMTSLSLGDVYCAPTSSAALPLCRVMFLT